MNSPAGWHSLLENMSWEVRQARLGAGALAHLSEVSSTSVNFPEPVHHTIRWSEL